MQTLHCYRCGTDLAELTLPLSRRDQCPKCRVDLHVCLMCTAYDPRQPDQCAEDDAADVHEKARANFCDYFAPSETAFTPGRMSAHRRAEAELAALFDDDAEPAAETSEDAAAEAEALFKR